MSTTELDSLLTADARSAAGSAATDAGPLEAHRTRPAEGDIDEMIRREFLRLMSLTGALISLPTDDAHHRTAEAATGTGTAQAANTHLWQVYGLAKAKRSVYPLVRDQLSDLAYTLGRPHSSAHHQEMCAEAADLYQLAGEISFDGNHYTQAAECYALAASASKEAGNADLWAASLTRHAFIGVYEKRFQQTSTLLHAAEVLARNGDSQLSTRHWVAAVQAQVHAGLGDLDACNRALDTAQEVHHLDTPCPGGWLRFDGSRLDEERGSCYVTLGRLDLAETALTDALASKLTLRRQGSVLTDLAMIGARRHDVDRMLSYGSAAVELAERTSSGYIGKKLEGLRGHLAPFLADRRVSDFIERIASLTAA